MAPSCKAPTQNSKIMASTMNCSFRQAVLPRLWLHQQQRCMAGHNKWSKIKRKKGVKDQARSTGFSKASRAITAAARTCDGDMSNLQLQSAIAHAKSIQLPKARIQDAIEKHQNSKGQAELLNMRYDCMMRQKQNCCQCEIYNKQGRRRTSSDGFVELSL